ncbi:MAG TPA: CapA family protein, partial [Myxococcota bacterium]|nr:CapA family protein [Myxococcota bacterium]
MLLQLLACDPSPAWPDPKTVYPYVSSPEELEPYEEVRWETESWDPAVDLEETGLYLQKSIQHRRGAPVESLEHFAQTLPELPPVVEGDLRLSMVGDIMWVGENWEAFATPSAGLLDGDLRLGNLETPTVAGESTELTAHGTYAFNSDPLILAALPVDLLQLTNNHAWDLGDPGVEATKAAVAAAGYTQVGLDSQAEVEVQGEKVALISYTWGLNQREVDSSHTFHIVPFGHVGDVDLSPLIAEIQAARASADLVVLMLHWGYEYEYYPDVKYMKMARELVAAGADVIVGSGPHVVQPPELCWVNHPEVLPGVGSCSLSTEDGLPRRAAIFYSLGNFGTTMNTLPCQMGIVGTLSLNGRDVTGIGWSAAVTLREEGLPWTRPAAEVQDNADVSLELERLRTHLGGQWER